MTVSHGAQAVEHLQYGLVELRLAGAPVQERVVHGAQAWMKTPGSNYICVSSAGHSILYSEKARTPPVNMSQRWSGLTGCSARDGECVCECRKAWKRAQLTPPGQPTYSRILRQ